MEELSKHFQKREKSTLSRETKSLLSQGKKRNALKRSKKKKLNPLQEKRTQLSQGKKLNFLFLEKSLVRNETGLSRGRDKLNSLNKLNLQKVVMMTWTE